MCSPRAFLSPAAHASDVLVTAGAPATFRVDGLLRIVDGAVFTSDEIREALAPVLTPEREAILEATGSVDAAWEVTEESRPAPLRFRLNLFHHLGGLSAAFRIIHDTIPSFQELHLPPQVADLVRYNHGLLLITGPTGSGKSTTLCALLEHINQTQQRHIITLEDPIEFVHQSHRALVNQREVGVHTQSFSRALRAALRQDPDIVLVGELRDRETIELALEVANTGHLVFGTLHTATAMGTVDRIVDIFPSDQQAQIRTTLAEVLRGVVSQALCKRRGGGRVAAIEILRVNAAVGNLIRKANTAQIQSVMQTQKAAGNRLLNDALQTLVREGKVDYDEAVSKSVDKDDLARRCGK